jgi:hypothetical protein
MNKKDVKCGNYNFRGTQWRRPFNPSMVNAAFYFISQKHKVDLEHPYKYYKFQQQPHSNRNMGLDI